MVEDGSSPECAICDTPLRLITRRTDKYSYYRCPGCSLVTSLPLPSARELSDFYDGFLFNLLTDEESHERQVAINHAVEKIVQDCASIADISPPFNVLDWGGGVGYYTNGFAQLGCNCTLIDIDPQACQHAEKQFPGKFEVINADPVEYRFSRRFDLIFCTHVVEHYVDVVGLLDAMRRVLAPGGIIILATPNQQCKEYFFRLGWLASYLKQTTHSIWQLPLSVLKFVRTPWICCDPPRHIHAFNQKSMTRLLEKAGFELLKSFGEYSGMQDYQFSTVRMDWRIRGIRSLLKIPYKGFMIGGIRMLRILRPDGRWGDNLVAYARPLPAKDEVGD